MDVEGAGEGCSVGGRGGLVGLVFGWVVDGGVDGGKGYRV